MCHEEVRQECVKFMEENRKDYEQVRHYCRLLILKESFKFSFSL